MLLAQERRNIPELRTFMGASVPTGGQRDLFKAGPVFGGQAAVELRETLHLLGTLAWSPVKNKFPVRRNDVQVLQYDIGMELGPRREMSDGWVFHPFVGAGGGGRTYLYDDATLSDETCAAFYGAVGTEFQLNRLAFRMEARDYVYCYKSPVPGVESKTRNNIGVAIGLAYHLR